MSEKLSAWMDNELGADETDALLPQLKRDVHLRQDWDCYHTIGDALRGVHGRDLCADIRKRLDAEPTVLAPRRTMRRARPLRIALSLAASMAAVAFVAWIALSGTTQEAAQMAAAPVAAPAPAVPSVQLVAVPAGAGAKDYLLAHQRYSPSSAMQGVASYVRTVADERSARR